MGVAQSTLNVRQNSWFNQRRSAAMARSSLYELISDYGCLYPPHEYEWPQMSITSRADLAEYIALAEQSITGIPRSAKLNVSADQSTTGPPDIAELNALADQSIAAMRELSESIAMHRPQIFTPSARLAESLQLGSGQLAHGDRNSRWQEDPSPPSFC